MSKPHISATFFASIGALAPSIGIMANDGIDNGNGNGNDNDSTRMDDDENHIQPTGKKRKYDGWIPILTRNRFDVLAHTVQSTSNNNDGGGTQTSSTSNSRQTHTRQAPGGVKVNRNAQSADQKKRSTTTRTPPITVIGKTRREVLDMCKSAGAKEDDVILKQTTVGINIYVSKRDNFTLLRDSIKQSSNCFTHELPDEKHTKIVLKGLFRMEIADLLAELESKQIKPVDVKYISPKRPKFDDQMNYLLFFKKGEMTLNDLKKCRSLCYLKVEWEFYIPKKFGPTQCHRCQMFGHGSRHCSLPVRCLYDGESHETHQCPSVQDGLMHPEFTPKCANCGGCHFANHPTCVKLQQYLQVQEALNDKNSHRNRSRQPVNRVPDLTNFPALPQPQRNNNAGQSTIPVSTNSQWGSAMPTQSTSFNPTGGSRRTDLFKGPELIQIAQEVITSLGRCSTPDEQYMTIVNLAVRFLYNGP